MLARRQINIGYIRRPSHSGPSFFKPILPLHSSTEKRALANSVPKIALRNFSSPVSRFFQVMNLYTDPGKSDSMLNLLRHEPLLKAKLGEVDSYSKGNYIHEHFISWLSRYSQSNPNSILGYLDGHISFESICKGFIKYCFDNGISLCAKKTLESFTYHNQLSDQAVKRELIKLRPKGQVNLLGFGLDEGAYEESIANYLLHNDLAQNVTVYGFDPYANKKNGIVFLDKNELKNSGAPKFDLITARWVLHHVAKQERWGDLISCINKCNPNARVIIVEHGFLRRKTSGKERRISDLLNGTFDIIANIGLRPNYFTDTLPDLGANFFIQYLRTSDFRKIKKEITMHSAEEIYDVGPSFPNQTICSIHVHSAKK